VLLALLAKFAWRPLLQALDSRQESIRKSLDDAQKAKQDWKRLQQRVGRDHPQARVEAEAIVDASRGDAERLREEMKQKARAEADSIVKNAERRSARNRRAPSSRSAAKRSTCR
jgi:F-type H+-transporting ATPase subunit b